MMSRVSLSSLFSAGCVLALVGLAASPAHADFTAYIIRSSGSGNVASTISTETLSVGISQFQGNIAKPDITRVDGTSRFAADIGPRFWQQ